MMKKILIVNTKGGCGKTTLATNLASYYALWGVPVALVDYDPQLSSKQWLQQRNPKSHKIYDVDATHKELSIPEDTKRVVMDSPARTTPKQIRKLFSKADVVLIPILPSPIDIRAAARHIGELVLDNQLNQVRIGLVANRVKENTIIFRKLEDFMKKLNIPIVSHLRDSQNYIRAAEGGYGVFEMSPYQVDKDIELWRPIIKWIEKK